MIKTFKLTTLIKDVSVEGEGEDLKITGYASTTAVDRSGDIILASAWGKGGLDNYKKNPIILFNHDRSKPIGKAIDLVVDANGLKITCLISKSAPDEIYGMIKDGILTTFSVGFGIKDVDYNEATDGFIIKEVDLYEVSVVSIPCNQDAMFSITKSFNNDEDLIQFKKELLGQALEASPQPRTDKVHTEKRKMEPDEIKALIAKATADALAEAAATKAAADAIAAKAIEDAEAVKAAATTAATVATKSLGEQLLAEFDTKVKASGEDFAKVFVEMKTDLEGKIKELTDMRNNKHQFADRGNGDWTANKALVKQADDAFILSKVLGLKSIDGTAFGTEVIKAVNAHSSANVGQDKLELTVSTQIEMDIQNALILAPLFQEIKMNSASMSFPIMPDAGYAEITTATTGSGSQPNGNLEDRAAAYGAHTGITLTEQTLSTIKMIAKTYLGNETEEDAILPVLPIIRDSMIRSHARGVENMILAGNHVDGNYTSNAANGLIKFASTNSRTTTAAGTATALTAAALLSLRKSMGKYGVDPRDVIYIVSQTAYFELIQDPEYQDFDLVGTLATKLTGEVGRIYGSSVFMCDEFAAPASGKYHALAVNTRNFLVPRLRGVRVESEDQVEFQRKVLVTSQRLGFAEKIPNAKAVVGLKYA